MNKKGFTLVELLAVIVILAILTTITVVSVNSIISDSENSLSETQMNTIKEAAKTYYLKEGVPSDISCVDVSELIEKGYIEGKSVIDPRTREPISGSVEIIYSSNQYSYEYKNRICTSCTIERQVAGKYTVGDVVTCGTEQFYVIENQDTDTTEGIDMLSKYNLTLTENPIQDKTGAVNGITFSSSNYWYDNTNKVYTVDTNYLNEGRKYPYVYGNYSGNNIYSYVEAYKDTIEGIGVNVIDAKLLSYEQTNNLGCVYNTNTNTCSSAPKWLYDMSYWTGSVYLGCPFSIPSSDFISIAYIPTFDELGIRPVITIPTYEIQ